MEWMYKEDIKIRSNNKQWRKLVDYYNQMREEKFWEKWYFEYTMRFDKVHIISKNMWFIKWLCINDKIDRSKFRKYSTGDTQWEREIQKIYYYWRISSNELNYTEWYSEVDELLMTLAVEDNPITVLLSILK